MSAPGRPSSTLPDPGARRLAVALLFLTPALWSANYLVARWAPGVIAPHMLALWRWLVAALLMLPFCAHEIVRERAAVRAQAWRFLVLGALGMWVCGAFVYIGGHSTSALNIGLIYAVSPVLVALVSALGLGERFGARQWAGVALALGGVLHIVLQGRWGALADVRVNTGDLWIAAAALCWSAYALLLRLWPSPVGGTARLTLTALGGVLVLLPFTALEAAWGGWPSTFGWRSVGLVLLAAVLPGAGAYAAFAYMQRVLGAARAGVVLYLSPLYAALTGWLVLGEPVTGVHLAGAALILPGIWLSTRR
ncbi:MAG TPA: DMT family transporter [Burkholderiaceae bacterium]|nr:DMT family transporter [Burkholderiaceae bacterium]